MVWPLAIRGDLGKAQPAVSFVQIATDAYGKFESLQLIPFLESLLKMAADFLQRPKVRGPGAVPRRPTGSCRLSCEHRLLALPPTRRWPSLAHTAVRGRERSSLRSGSG